MAPGRRAGIAAALLFLLALLYLVAWPVPVDPQAWDAPADRGIVDPFGPDDRLQRIELIDIAPYSGPEDVAIGPDGLIYASTHEGKILRFRPDGADVQQFVDPGGRPLGIEFDAAGNLFVANAYLGLQRILPDGTVETLADEFDNDPIKYADDVAVAKDGTVYFSDASSKFGAREYGGTYEASLLDIMEHGGHGRVFRYLPADGSLDAIIGGLNFANGVAVSEDQQFLLVSETGSYRILKFWLEGPRAGQREVLLDNLPGFPDNINNGMAGRFWVGLVAPRSAPLDTLANSPWLRKVVQRFPQALRPQAEPSSHVFAIDGDGEVLINLRDPAAGLPALTGVAETTDSLWLSSLFGNHVGRLDKRDLAH